MSNSEAPKSDVERRAKIAGTLGPACDAQSILLQMIDAGLDVARLNFSHGSPADHRRRVRRLRRASREAGRATTVLADLQGPRFRVGRLPGGFVDLTTGHPIELIAGRQRSREGTLPVSYAALSRDVRRGDRILIDDGNVVLQVERLRGDRVVCSVERGGRISDHKGINLPGVALSVPTLTRKDREDLRLAVALGADWLALSFVRCAEDLRLARRLLRREGRELPLLAKIERREAIDQLDEIMAEADGILVARGDLGVELAAERVPILQKQIIEAAARAGKPVMTATQMLESMREAPRPTRAEASDVANAVIDGSGCLLLTAETAVGKYPVEAIATMARIIRYAEGSGRGGTPPAPTGAMSVPLATCRAGCRAAHDVGASYIIAFTHGGFTATQTARFRPDTPILGFTTSERMARRLNLLWGVEPHRLPHFKSIEALIQRLDRALVERDLAEVGDTVVVLASSPIGVGGTTNLIQVHRVGERRRRA